MKKNSKERLFEVMGRLDKTFKPKLNEGFEEIESTDDVETTDDVALPPEMSVGDEMGAGEEVPEEKSPEEKLSELTSKVDELYALLHGETEEPEMGAEVPAEDDVDVENLQEWNFDKKKGEDKEEDKEEKKNDDKEEKKEDKEEDIDESSKKIPVEAVAKVGK